ncbi:MAG: Amidohydro-rel protein [Actinobacteria bacterium]|nr:Amidohydro-rel protein [Actinomycetota bacterium]
MMVISDNKREVVYIASRIFLDSATVLSPGAVAVRDGTVVAAGRPREVERSLSRGFDRKEFPGAAILPGLVNAHTHLQIPRLTIPAGGATAESSSFVEWILGVIAWRSNAPPDEFLLNFETAAAEAISFGTTAVGEISRPDQGIYGSCSLRARLFAEGIGFTPEAAGESLAAVEAALARLEECARESGGLVAPGLSPHTLYTVGPALLGLLGDLAARKGVPACLHLAESPAEMEFLSTGGGPVATLLYPAVGRDVSWFRGIGMSIPSYLEKAGLLREGLLLVHNVHLSRGDIGILRQRGARFVLCPRSNAAHGNGSPDVTHFVDTGIPFALGTDSLGSVPDVSVWEEMRAARSIYRGSLSDAELCRVLFRAGTGNGAAALGLAGGSLRSGGAADFILADNPQGDGGAAIINLVERTKGRNVLMTVVGGSSRFERA